MKTGINLNNDMKISKYMNASYLSKLYVARLGMKEYYNY